MMRLLALLWLGAMLLMQAGDVRADTPVALFKSFAGNVNFAGTQETMRVRNNNSNACTVVSSTSEIKARLSDLPTGAEVLSAQLYWAGSNAVASADYRITFEGTELTAEPARQYFSHTSGSGSDYFGGAVDVTAQVKAKRNGDYSFSGLTISNGAPYCGAQGVVGGFSLLVIYSHADEPYRVLNLYEGFQYILNSSITLNLSNFLVPTPLPSKATGRIGHITWEGDSTIDQNGERLLFNGYEMVDNVNKAGNQFNSKSNINGDTSSYGIDFDAYSVQSPVIGEGQTSATTVYQSGQDLVLLNAEIVALPNVPTADLVMSLTRNGDLKVGATTTYTLTASNAGPNTEPGKVTVTVTLPDSLGYQSATGTGWTCSASGQTISCSSPGPLKKGESLPPITLTVQARSAGSATVTAKVAGQLFDHISGNNTVSNASTVAATGANAFVFTVGACNPNIAIGEANKCSRLPAAVSAGEKIDLYVTAVSEAGIPIALNTAAETSVPLRFSLSCELPQKSAGTSAVFGTVPLKECEEAGQVPAASGAKWSDKSSLIFLANTPSARPGEFQYDDVGQVRLNLIDEANKTVSISFVSKPVSIDFEVSRNDGIRNPGAANGDPVGFVKAGEAFTIRLGAKTVTGTFAKNFGNEGLQVGLAGVLQPGQAALAGNFTKVEKGVQFGNEFFWEDVGVLKIEPTLSPNNYLETGPVTLNWQLIGRFYPAYLQTTIESNFNCMPIIGCPAGITGAAYSLQPFKVNIAAFSLKDSRLANYRGTLARDTTLHAFDRPGGDAANPGGGTLSENLYKAKDNPGPLAINDVFYQLPVPFRAAVPRTAWGAPTSIYLRASSKETVAVTDTTTAEQTISSKREPATTVEGGIRIVNGRLQLANAFGSELLRLPVPMNAQYWTGSAWANNSADNKSKVEFVMEYTSCAKKLAVVGRAAPDNCNLDLLKVQPAPVVLKDGAGKLWLGAPGNGNLGSAWLQVKDNPASWLPSTRARAVFGVHKSPLIYVREVY